MANKTLETQEIRPLMQAEVVLTEAVGARGSGGGIRHGAKRRSAGKEVRRRPGWAETVQPNN